MNEHLKREHQIGLFPQLISHSFYLFKKALEYNIFF